VEEVVEPMLGALLLWLMNEMVEDEDDENVWRWMPWLPIYRDQGQGLYREDVSRPKGHEPEGGPS
jgi:hypothetical protein